MTRDQNKLTFREYCYLYKLKSRKQRLMAVDDLLKDVGYETITPNTLDEVALVHNYGLDNVLRKNHAEVKA